MEIKAQLRYLRMSPKKVRLVANLIRGASVREAENQLLNCRKKAQKPILKYWVRKWVK